MSGTAAPEKLLALESLRGVAALTVALHHFSYGSPLTSNAFVAHGYLLVDFFFVLSGFVIALNYRERLSSRQELIAFQTKRFWRLYPLHFATLLVFLLIEAAKWQFERSTGIQSNAPAFVVSDHKALAAHLVLLQGVLLERTGFNVPSWSISTEFWAYLVFALIVLLTPRWPRVALVVIAAAFMVIVAMTGGRLETDPRMALVRCLYGFLLGALAFELMTARGGMAGLQRLAVPLLIASIAAITLLGGTRLEILLPPLFALTVIAVSVLPAQSGARRFMEWPSFVWLGTISYSIYMTHSIVGWGMTQMLRFGFKLPTSTSPAGSQYVVLEPALATLVVLVCIVAVLALSQFTYVWIEKAFRHGLPWRRQQPEQSHS